MDGRKNNRGTKGNKGGRPKKVAEQKLIEALSPMAETAYKGLERALKDGEPWAIKMWMEYYHGKPHMQVREADEESPTVNIEGRAKGLNDISADTDNDN